MTYHDILSHEGVEINQTPSLAGQYMIGCTFNIPPPAKYVKTVKEVKMNFNVVPANLQRMMRLLDVSPKLLAASIGMSERNLYRRFKDPSKFTLGELDTISRKYKISLDKILESA